MEFITPGAELIPLNARMQNIEDIIKYLIEGEFWLWAFDSLREMGQYIPIKILSGNLLGNLFVYWSFLSVVCHNNTFHKVDVKWKERDINYFLFFPYFTTALCFTQYDFY